MVENGVLSTERERTLNRERERMSVCILLFQFYLQMCSYGKSHRLAGVSTYHYDDVHRNKMFDTK